MTQILSGEENLTLRSLAATAWALGLRLRLDAEPVNRAGTPAENDPPTPSWLAVRRTPQVMWRVASPKVEPKVPEGPAVAVDSQGRLRELVN